MESRLCSANRTAALISSQDLNQEDPGIENSGDKREQYAGNDPIQAGGAAGDHQYACDYEW
jgi:hypothetical protein